MSKLFIASRFSGGSRFFYHLIADSETEAEDTMNGLSNQQPGELEYVTEIPSGVAFVRHQTTYP